MNQKVLPLLVILVAIASFLVGFEVRGQLPGQTRVNVGGGTGTVEQVTPTGLPPLAIESLRGYALVLGLDVKKFDECLDGGKEKDKIDSDVAMGTSLGVTGTPAFFVNGRFLGGAFPFANFKEVIDKELAGQGSNNAKSYSADLQKAADDKYFIPKSVVVKISESDQVRGPNDAKVTIVEFSDYQCPYCVQASNTVNQILGAYKDQVRFIYKNFPLTNIHPYAEKAAEAALCAAEQGKFWEYHDKLFKTQLGQ
jgi:protein-disulfide isomerase